MGPALISYLLCHDIKSLYYSGALLHNNIHVGYLNYGVSGVEKIGATVTKIGFVIGIIKQSSLVIEECNAMHSYIV